MTSSVVPARPAPGENWSRDDPPLHDLLARALPKELADEAARRLDAMGRVAAEELDHHARMADRHRPVLHPRTPEGERADAVEFHPSYRELQRIAREHGVLTLPYDGRRASRVLGFALGYIYAQAESGYYCPACMTDGAAFVLSRHAPRAMRDAYVPRLTANTPEGAFEGAMYLTEKGGGSDVGGGTATTAREHDDGTWGLTGEKWFASNCVADVALALARMPGGAAGTRGLGLFLVPRALDDGTPNPGLRIARLKDKLGVTSMPTGEVILDDARALLIAGEDAGFKAMAEMVNLSRLYNAVASVAIARRAVREGQRAGTHRESFGKPLREHSLFLATLTRLTVETEGALALVLDAAAAFDRAADGDAEAARLLRVLTPCAKAMTAKLALRAASEGCEMLGGVGYIEEYVTPRLLRDAQVLPIWEGTTNIQALDLLRALDKAEGALDAFTAHARRALNEGRGTAGTAKAAARVEAALERLAHEVTALEREERATREAAALRLLAAAYHAHAAALLVAVTANAGHRGRAARVADLYAALFVEEGRNIGEQALEAVAAARDVSIAYPGEMDG